MTESTSHYGANIPDPNLPPQQAPQVPQPPVEAEEPATNLSGLSIGAIVAAVGAVLVLISYPLVWTAAKADSRANVTGLGKVTNTETYTIIVTQGRLHWVAAVAMLVLVGFAVARLFGKYNDKFKRVPILCAVVSLFGAGSRYLTIGSQFVAGAGLYLALVGSVVALGGAVAMSLGK